MRQGNAVLNGLKWVGVALIGMGGLALLVLLVSWLLPVPAAERAALAAMMAAPAAQDPARDAFPAMWLLPYDGIAPAQVQVLAAQDALRFAQRGAARDAGSSVAAGRFPKITAATGWCGRTSVDCLREVRADADAVAAAHHGHDALHERIASLGSYDHYHSAFSADPAMPLPEFQVLLERTSLHALQHVRGNSVQALQGLCEDIGSGRMLMGSSDSLIVAMVGGAMVERNARLFTDVLSELPADVRLPAQCRRALAAPTPAELDLCLPMRGEFAFHRAAMAQLPAAEKRWLFDEPKTLARSAWMLSRSCSDGVRAQLRDDRPVQLAPAPDLLSLPCVANAAGCIAWDINAPAYAPYSRRIQDVGARLRISAAMLWLREQPRDGREVMEVLAEMPAALSSLQRPLQLGEDRRGVQVDRYGALHDNAPSSISAPLPKAWQPE